MYVPKVEQTIFFFPPFPCVSCNSRFVPGRGRTDALG